jgi:hypothetical protein
MCALYAADGIERVIDADGTLLAIIVNGTVGPQDTVFLTDSAMAFQLGFVVYAAGGAVPAHRHLPVERELTETSEVVMVRTGECEVDVYDEAQALVATRTLAPGDLVLLLAGGHGFRMNDDTVLLEIKQGPYTGIQEKERF